MEKVNKIVEALLKERDNLYDMKAHARYIDDREQYLLYEIMHESLDRIIKTLEQ